MAFFAAAQAGGRLGLTEARGEGLGGVLTLHRNLGLGGVAVDVKLFERLLGSGLGHDSPQILFSLRGWPDLLRDLGDLVRLRLLRAVRVLVTL